MPPVVQPTKAGKLKMLAVTSTKRSPTLPEVPAVAEIKGMEGYRFTNWMGLFAPAKTPPEAIDRLAKEIAKIVREPAVKEKLLSQGVVGEGNTTEEFAAFLKNESAVYGKIAKERNIRSGN
jgi:tripartite-type tricarboxylate transporter receptor subunit TctC